MLSRFQRHYLSVPVSQCRVEQPRDVRREEFATGAIPPPCPWLVVRWPVLANLLCIGIVHCCGAALCDGIGSENVPCGAVGSWDGLELFGYVPDAMS